MVATESSRMLGHDDVRSGAEPQQGAALAGRPAVGPKQVGHQLNRASDSVHDDELLESPYSSR